MSKSSLKRSSENKKRENTIETSTKKRNFIASPNVQKFIIFWSLNVSEAQAKNLKLFA